MPNNEDLWWRKNSPEQEEIRRANQAAIEAQFGNFETANYDRLAIVASPDGSWIGYEIHKGGEVFRFSFPVELTMDIVTGVMLAADDCADRRILQREPQGRA
jgi:hypothetical protein